MKGLISGKKTKAPLNVRNATRVNSPLRSLAVSGKAAAINHDMAKKPIDGELFTYSGIAFSHEKKFSIYFRLLIEIMYYYRGHVLLTSGSYVLSVYYCCTNKFKERFKAFTQKNGAEAGI